MPNNQNNRKMNAVLIGAGRISHAYQAGLAAADGIDLRAVIDINPNAAGFDLYPNAARFYTVDSLPETEEIELAIISTPPKTHDGIIRSCLHRGLHVIVEKPLIPGKGSVSALYRLAKKNALILNTAFHWQYGEEVCAFNAAHTPDRISQIEIAVSDPYSANGTAIDANRLNLEGAWIDSGVNALSLIAMWLPLKDVTVISVEAAEAENARLPICCSASLLADGVPVRITVDWRKQIDSKLTRLIYAGKEIVIHHSRQTVFEDGKAFTYDSMPRLSRHYYNYFTRRGYQYSNESETTRIHDVLMKVKDAYEKTFD